MILEQARAMHIAACEPYRVLRVTPRMVDDGRALRLIERALS